MLGAVSRTLAKFQSLAAIFDPGFTIAQDAFDPVPLIAKANTHTHYGAFGCKAPVLCPLHCCWRAFYKKSSVQVRNNCRYIVSDSKSPAVRIWFFLFINFLVFCTACLRDRFPSRSHHSTQQKLMEFWVSRKHIVNYMLFAIEILHQKF